MAGSNTIQALERGLVILEAVAASPEGLTLHELGEHLDVGGTTVFNLARTLVLRGYLEKTRRPVRYRLGGRFHALGSAAPQPDWRSEAERQVRALMDEDVVHNAIAMEVQGDEIIRFAKMDKTRPGVVQYPRNPVVPYATATGVCALAFFNERQRNAYVDRYPFEEFGAGMWGEESSLLKRLNDFRKQGFSELARGPYRAAFPVFNGAGEIIAAIGAGIPKEEPISLRRNAQLRKALQRSADAINELARQVRARGPGDAIPLMAS